MVAAGKKPGANVGKSLCFGDWKVSTEVVSDGSLYPETDADSSAAASS